MAAWPPQGGGREGAVLAGSTDMAPITLSPTQPWPSVLKTLTQQSERRQSTDVPEGPHTSEGNTPPALKG